MWEAIRANKWKSVFLATTMLVLLGVLGFVIGMALFPAAVDVEAGARIYSVSILGGLFGMVIAGGIWVVMTTVAYFNGSSILMAASGARQIEKQDHPQLFNVVEEMTIASGMGKMPAVYIIDDPALNAFATGRNKDHAAVAITSGLLARLNRDQLQGVIAHEMGHIINRDILFMQMLGIMAGTIVIISDIYVRGMFYSSMAGRRRSRTSSRGKGNQAQAIMMLLALVLAILSPIIARIIYLAASRRREYLADAQSAVLTRYPEGLASALELIESDGRQLARINRTTAPMFICNPYKQGLSASGLMRTHPPTEERIRILRSMAGNASYAEYQRASENIGAAAGIPASALAAGAGAAIREAHPDAQREPKKAQQKAQWRQATDAVRSANNFAFLTCPCGLRLKLPPNFKKDKVTCPKCHRELTIPVAAMATAGAIGHTLENVAQTPPPVPKRRGKHGQEKPLVVKRKPGTWTTFRCPCGQTNNLSPSLNVDTVRCRRCGRTIHIEDAA
ncbi:MAG: M48 family metallopeptidase [Candidatus Hydrogenedentes bacterium]|nr:M48 family metallopeptidase [Candidatus Hydrogenedentota bacterium]